LAASPLLAVAEALGEGATLAVGASLAVGVTLAVGVVDAPPGLAVGEIVGLCPKTPIARAMEQIEVISSVFIVILRG
jgi:hypothetical protein